MSDAVKLRRARKALAKIQDDANGIAWQTEGESRYAEIHKLAVQVCRAATKALAATK